MAIKLTNEEIIKQFKNVHGDKYDYSLFEYKGSLKKSKIICHIHGGFEQTPSKHKNGQGCPNCLNKNLSRIEIINQFNIIHNNTYDYSKMIYITTENDIEIICKKHGSFFQKPKYHKRGQKCPTCTKEDMSKKYRTIDENLITIFNNVHNNFYNYSKMEYINQNKKIIIKCPIHGEFLEKPINHKEGAGCPECKNEKEYKSVINKLEKIHGKYYDYSKMKYINQRTEIEIICKKHGSFFQEPKYHIAGYGCKECKKEEEKKDFLENLKKIHKNKYDYSKVEYIYKNQKIIIICPIHGEFLQKAETHQEGHGCRECAKNYLSEKFFLKDCNRKNKENYNYSNTKYNGIKTNIIVKCHIHGEFSINPVLHRKGKGCPICKQEQEQENHIKNFNMIHNNNYDYSKVKYINLYTNIEIICKKHGAFYQKPKYHLNGQGCKECEKEIRQEKEENFFINICNKVHKNYYNYSETKYIDSGTKIKIICPEHGEFFQRADNHKLGQMCWKCAKTPNLKELIKKFNKKHNFYYDYSLVNLVNAKTKIKIKCPEHGIFNQDYSSHLKGKGCHKCAKHGFKKNNSAILYYLRIEKDGKIAYKIGITNRSVKERFEKDFKYITILKEWYYESGEECYEQEQKILKEFSYAKWKRENILKAGNSEMFDRDILLLDN